VLDFGISTINEPNSDSRQTLTKEGTLLGTPAYMSPEQLENPRNLDARADVYAPGVILYECLTGKLPFEADTAAKTAPKPSAVPKPAALPNPTTPRRRAKRNGGQGTRRIPLTLRGPRAGPRR
jgi:serine/threonine protein kinase